MFSPSASPLRPYLLSLIALCCLSLVSLSAQDTRGTILGTVRDASGAALGGATVVATNTETKISNTATSNESGLFEIPYLVPGTYEISASASGFKKFVQSGITVSIGTRTNVTIDMQVGQVSEEVIVSATPILETTSANGSATLSSLEVRNFPTFGNNALLAARSVPGIQWTGQPNYLGLHSNVGASAITAAGGVGGTEFTLDGVPNSGPGRRVGFMPNNDSVEEIKVDAANFDARSGHSSSATVSMVTKGGTNDFHGTLNLTHWQQRWNGTQATTNAQYWGPIIAAENRGDTATANRLRAGQRQVSGHSNNYSGNVGGPVRIPWLYNGREKLFFFFSYNGLRENKSEEPTAVNRTVPTAKMRNGDFSELLSLGARYQIYDPRTARCSDGLPGPCTRSNVFVVRSPFANNQVPILNPLFKYYMSLYPLPNNTNNADGTNNYLASGTPFNWKYKAYQNRLDYNLSARQKMTGKWSWNDFLEDRSDWTYETARGLHSNGLVRQNLGITLDYVFALSSTTSINLSVGFNRFIEGNKLNARQLADKPSTVGLPSYLDDKAGDFKRLPVVSISGYETISGSYPGFGRFSTAFTRGELSKSWGNHTIISGYDLRHQYRATNGPGNTSGSFSFNNSFMTRQSNNPDNAAQLGLSLAAFALGVPSGVSIDTNDSLYLTNPYRAGYVQDNWRVNQKLTLNLGFRLEWEGGFKERFNRGVTGFDLNATLPITAGAEAAFANVAAAVGIPASQFKVRGGTTYLGKDGAPDTFNKANWSYLPRVGFAYSLNDKTVVRGGYGIFADTINVLNFGIDQTGYNRATITTITNDNGLTFLNADLANGKTLLSDPFPVRADGTRFNVPLGNALGLMNRVGRGQTFVNYDWTNAKQQRWRFGIQREIRKGMALDVAYLGSFTSNVSTNNNNPGDADLTQTLSYLPEQYWATGLVRQQALADALNSTVTNPFYIDNFASLKTSNPVLYQDMSTNSFFTNRTISKAALLRAYPHMNGLSIARLDAGKLKYHHLEVSLTQRFRRGLTATAAYTWASSQVSDFRENEFDQKTIYRQNPNYRPHHLMLNGVWELPFGKGHKWLADNKWLGALVGGWQTTGVFHLQPGRTYDFGNVFFFGKDLRAIKASGDNQTTDHWFNWELFPGAARDYVACTISNPTACKPWLDRVSKLVPAEYLPSNLTFDPNDPAIAAKTKRLATPTDFQPAGFHRRVFPTRLNFLRGDKMAQLDLSITRKFMFTERVGMEFKTDLINATNTVQWDNPSTDVNSSNFGKVTQQYNTPRWIQFSLRFVF